MAEGWAHALRSDVLEAFSAGIETHGLNPLAVKVMAEAGVDISGHRSKKVGELINIPFDLVVTVCGHAHEHCPRFPGKTKVIHAGFEELADDHRLMSLGAHLPADAFEPLRTALQVGHPDQVFVGHPQRQPAGGLGRNRLAAADAKT